MCDRINSLLRDCVRRKKHRLNSQRCHIAVLPVISSRRDNDLCIKSIRPCQKSALLALDRKKIYRRIPRQVGDDLGRRSGRAEHRVDTAFTQRLCRFRIGHILNPQHVGSQPVGLQDLRRVLLRSGILFAYTDGLPGQITHRSDPGVRLYDDLHRLRIQSRHRRIAFYGLCFQRPRVHLVDDVGLCQSQFQIVLGKQADIGRRAGRRPGFDIDLIRVFRERLCHRVSKGAVVAALSRCSDAQPLLRAAARQRCEDEQQSRCQCCPFSEFFQNIPSLHYFDR